MRVATCDGRNIRNLRSHLSLGPEREHCQERRSGVRPKAFEKRSSSTGGASCDSCPGADGIFHQAAIPSVPRSVKDPIASNEANITGTLNVLVAAKDCGVPAVVAASSSSVYGDIPGSGVIPAPARR